MRRFERLDQWLNWLEQAHPKKIDLGLARTAEVAARLGLTQIAYPVVSIAGTNGKGSTVAMMASILQAAGLSVGTYTSPHLLRYNERIRVGNSDATDARIIEAFTAIDQARGEISLSYFEFSTLAAMWIFTQQGVDCALLEVGLGGRLDAVNVWHADVAVLTSIGIDHTHWLGETHTSIALEKAGIARSGRPCICGDPEPPDALLDYAQRSQIICRRIGLDYWVTPQASDWTYTSQHHTLTALPWPALRGRHQLLNAATAITALYALPEALRPQRDAIAQGLREAQLAGRYERLTRNFGIVLDVAHNPQGAQRLRDSLEEDAACYTATWALLGMLADKDIEGFFCALADQVTHWVVCRPDSPRALPAAVLAQKLRAASPGVSLSVAETVDQAYTLAQAQLTQNDRLLVTGSFYTVAELRQKLL